MYDGLVIFVDVVLFKDPGDWKAPDPVHPDPQHWFY